jgi:uridine kinase
MDASNDGLLPWYDDKGKAKDVYVIGVAGGSASGKTSVAQAILKDLANSTWMGIISQDSFYKHLDHDQQLLAFNNKYNFDHPNAFDFDLLSDCIAG